MADFDDGFRVILEARASYAKLVEAYGENIVVEAPGHALKDVARFRAAGDALYEYGGDAAMNAASRVLQEDYGESWRANGISLDRLWNGVGDWKS